eukprot:SM000216S06572  [mRNA]  locus=s216:135653:137133:- [translate_table: standard]
MLAFLKACFRCCQNVAAEVQAEQQQQQPPPPWQAQPLPQQHGQPPPYSQHEQQSWAQIVSSDCHGAGSAALRPQYYHVPAAQYEAYQRPHQEQNYGPDLGIGSDLAPAPEELNSLAAAAARLWALDANRLVPGRDYEIAAGGGKKVYQRGADFGGASLFRYVNPAVFARPTYARFFALLDNYNPDDSITELDTAANREEQRAFIEEAWRTPPVQYLHHYLAAKGLAPQDPGQFKAMLLWLWFKL